MIQGVSSCSARHEMHDLHDCGPLLVPLRQHLPRLPMSGASKPPGTQTGPCMRFRGEAGLTESRALSRTSEATSGVLCPESTRRRCLVPLRFLDSNSMPGPHVASEVSIKPCSCGEAATAPRRG